ncbi:uncharacterized protein BO72DRAFT_33314 [Aspergillus fijiensis CBS 313.89]|uniref:Uncharacterized protein n=1 Tax=Aspergillus fijiensis CBS 313.89 TaxID=1448319 RepID=A0A8G1W1F2_9EURO|nr:uncharacterized protein BO72DRAFT_33314 [Aspergillus fijiensis CBS 313.89]RAK79623.1 hypothetical protein BO72DRAFT_33314 [Aspergillus fijiensis CBS 313.89]
MQSVSCITMAVGPLCEGGGCESNPKLIDNRSHDDECQMKWHRGKSGRLTRGKFKLSGNWNWNWLALSALPTADIWVKETRRLGYLGSARVGAFVIFFFFRFCFFSSFDLFREPSRGL